MLPGARPTVSFAQSDSIHTFENDSNASDKEDFVSDDAPAATVCSATVVDLDARKAQNYTNLINATAGSARACWHCVHAFEHNARCALPVRAGAVNGGPPQVVGEFCSFSCAAAWAIERKMHCNSDTLMLLNNMAVEQGVRIPVARAPPAEALDLFGGPLSIEEFRAIGRDYVPTRILRGNQISVPVMLEGYGKAVAEPPVKKRAEARADVSMSDMPRAMMVNTPYQNFIAARSAAGMQPRKKARATRESSGLLANFVKQPKAGASNAEAGPSAADNDHMET
tara:strand:- start:13320 stop:14165 length:846 start_codon:yes stop_codon:yes gene_type:complete